MTHIYLSDRPAMLAWKLKWDTQSATDDDDAPQQGQKPYNDDWDTETVAGNWDYIDLAHTIAKPQAAGLRQGAGAGLPAISSGRALRSGRGRGAGGASAPVSQPHRAGAREGRCGVVLGGGFGDRERSAAEIYREGLAPTLVLMGMEDSVNDKDIDYLHWRSRVLARAGVPEGAMLVDPASPTSDDEAAHALKLARKHGWKRLIVVSDPPHMRRLSIAWGRAFDGSGIEVVLVPTRPAWWVPVRWWSSGKSANFVVMEYIKLAYTLLYN